MLTPLIGSFVYLLGLCVGSFLNVVIYRLPRGLSIWRPAWSFCPRCGTTLRWYDNLPVVGWLLLGARCRYCRQPISVQYPLVEAITGLVFVLIYNLLVVERARVLALSGGVAQMLEPTWPTDLPFVLAWLVLAAVLISCAGMDLASYVVDIQVTNVAVAAGIVLHALWPRAEYFAARAASPLAAATVAAFIVSGLMLWRRSRKPGEHDEPPVQEPTPEGEAHVERNTSGANLATVVAAVLLVGLAVWLLVRAAWPGANVTGALELAVPMAFGALFAAIVLAAGQPRQVDQELRLVIEAETPTARRLAGREALWLAPPVAAALLTYVLLRTLPGVAAAWSQVTGWATLDGLAPVGGAVFAIHGAMLAAAAGWIVRIFFTLALGREALGVGDIYILAAAGAIGGWDIALLGFLLSIFIALAGWLLGLVFKRVGMIPFGPPLALGFLAALWLDRPAALRADAYYRDLAAAWHQRPELVALLVGVMVVLLPLSLMAARLVRHFVEGPQEPTAGVPDVDRPPAEPSAAQQSEQQEGSPRSDTD